MSVIFWDVDTQADFILPTGKLYVPGAESIIPNLRKLTDYAHANGIRIVASADEHADHDPELSATPDWVKTFPPHCMRSEPGQRKIEETALDHPLLIRPEPQDPNSLAARIRGHAGDILLNKHTFDVFTNENTETVIETLRPTTIVLYGVATDVCNKYAVEGIVERHPHIRLFVVEDAMKGIKPDAQEHLLKEWAEEGVRVVSTDEIVEDGIPE